VLKEWKWAEDAALETAQRGRLSAANRQLTIRRQAPALSIRPIETSTGHGFVTGGCRRNSSIF
jgi:hypothetical protein